MKKRMSKVANFFAFNLLFFALYLNFIHQENSVLPTQTNIATATVKGTVSLDNPGQYIQKQNDYRATARYSSITKQNDAALKLSFN